MSDNPRKKIYDVVSSAGLYTKSYEEFTSQYDSPEAITDLHSVLRQREFYTKDLSDFVGKYYSDKYTFDQGAIKPIDTIPQKKSPAESAGGGSGSKASGSTASAPIVAVDSEIDFTNPVGELKKRGFTTVETADDGFWLNKEMEYNSYAAMRKKYPGEELVRVPHVDGRYLYRRKDEPKQIALNRAGGLLNIDNNVLVSNPTEAVMQYYQNTGREKSAATLKSLREGRMYSPYREGKAQSQAFQQMQTDAIAGMEAIRKEVGNEAIDNFLQVRANVGDIYAQIQALQNNPSPDALEKLAALQQDESVQESIRQYQNYLSSPSYQTYDQLIGKYHSVIDAVETSKVQFPEYWQEEAQAEAVQTIADLFKKSGKRKPIPSIPGVAIIPGIEPFVRQVVEAASGIANFVPHAANIVSSDDKYRWSDAWIENVNRAMNVDNQLVTALSSDRTRQVVEQVADVNGFKAVVSNGQVTAVRDQDGFLVRNKDVVSSVKQMYEQTPESYETTRKVNKLAALDIIQSGTAQIATSAIPAGMLSKVSKGVAIASTIGTQTAQFTNSGYEAALAELGTENKGLAERYAMGTAAVQSSINMIIQPLETMLPGITKSIPWTRLLKTNATKMADDLARGMKPSAAYNRGLKRFIQDAALPIVSATGKEGFEGVLEQLSDLALREFTNSQTDPTQQLSTDWSAEAFQNAFIEESLGGIMASGAAKRNPARFHLESMLAAYDAVDRAEALKNLPDDVKQHYQQVFSIVDTNTDGKTLTDEARMEVLFKTHQQVLANNKQTTLDNEAAKQIREQKQAEINKIIETGEGTGMASLSEMKLSPDAQPTDAVSVERGRQRDIIPSVGVELMTPGGSAMTVTEVVREDDEITSVKYRIDEGNEVEMGIDEYRAVVNAHYDNKLAELGEAPSQAELEFAKHLAQTTKLDSNEVRKEEAEGQEAPQAGDAQQDQQADAEQAVVVEVAPSTEPVINEENQRQDGEDPQKESQKEPMLEGIRTSEGEEALQRGQLPQEGQQEEAVVTQNMTGSQLANKVIPETVDDHIATFFAEGGRIKPGDYRNMGDPNTMDSRVKLQFTDSNESNLDIVAEQIATETGRDPQKIAQSIISFINSKVKPKDHLSQKLAQKEPPMPTYVEYDESNIAQAPRELVYENSQTNDLIRALPKISKLLPGFKFVLHENGDAMRDNLSNRVSVSKGTVGVRIGNEIHLNLARAGEVDALHEAMHPIMDAVIEENPEMLDNFYDDLLGLQKEKGTEWLMDILSFASQYGNEREQRVEAVVEALSRLASDPSILDKSKGLFQKIQEFINNLAQRLGISTPKDRESILSFAQSVRDALEEGRVMKIKLDSDPQFKIDPNTIGRMKATEAINKFYAQVGTSLPEGKFISDISKAYGISEASARAILASRKALDRNKFEKRKQARQAFLQKFNLEGTTNLMSNFHAKWLSSTEGAPSWIRDLRERREGVITARWDYAVKLQTKAKKLAKKKGLSVDDVDAYMRGDKSIQLDKEMKTVLNEMRDSLDSLSKILLEEGYVSGEAAKSIAGNIGTYLTRKFRIFEQKNYKPTAEAREAAIQFFIGEMQNIKTFAGLPAEKLRDLAEGRVNEYLAKAESMVGGSGKEGSVDPNMVKRRKDLPKPIRDLYGEYTDPYTAYLITMHNLAKFVTNHRFLRALSEVGQGKVFWDRNDPNKPKDASFKIAGDESKSYFPLRGMYTTKEVYDVLTKMDDIDTYGELGWLNSFINWNTTVGSVVTQFRNVEGGIIMSANVGLGLLSRGNPLDAIARIKDLALNRDDPDVEAAFNMLKEQGLIGNSIAVGGIRDQLNKLDNPSYVQGLLKQSGESYAEYINRVITDGKLSEFYQGVDDIFKVGRFVTESEAYAQSIFKKPYKELTEEEKDEINDIAVEIVKNTYPNYSRLGKAAKWMQRNVLLGVFISFKAEALRTQYNTLALSMYEMSRPELRSVGADRFASQLAVNLINEMAVGISNHAVGLGFGGIAGAIFSDEEEKGKQLALRTAVPPWADLNDLVTEYDPKTDTYRVYDASASYPFSSNKRLINAIAYSKGIGSAGGNLLEELREQFVDVTIMGSLLGDLYSGYNAYGNRIANPSRTMGQQALQYADYIAEKTQGSYRTAKKYIKDGVDPLQVMGLNAYEFTPIESFTRSYLDYANFKHGTEKGITDDLRDAAKVSGSLDEFESRAQFIVKNDKRIMDELRQSFLHMEMLSHDPNFRANVKSVLEEKRASVRVRKYINEGVFEPLNLEAYYEKYKQ